MAVHDFWRLNAEDGTTLDPGPAAALQHRVAQQPAELRRPDREAPLVRARAGVLAPQQGGLRAEDVPPRRRARSEGAAPMNAENPFCTRCVRPGAIPFLFDRRAGILPAAGDCSAGILPACSTDRQDACATTAAALVARLCAANWRGQIVGPHGSGKSALLATLVPVIERAGQRVLLLELHDAERTLPRNFWRGPELASCTLLIVDGYEQLGRWTRFRLDRFCRRPRLCRTGFQPVPDELETHPTERRTTFQVVPNELETHPTGLLVTAHASVGLPDLFRTAVDRELACRIVAQLQRGYRLLVTAHDVAECFLATAGTCANCCSTCTIFTNSGNVRTRRTLFSPAH